MKAAYASATTLGLVIGAALVLRAVITPRPASARADTAPARPSHRLIEPGARPLPTPAEMSGWAAAGSSLD